MKIYFTHQELINQWLEKWPSDKDHPVLEQMALGGYVKTKQGYIWHSYYGLE